MKIIINATNIIEDRPLREVERLINLGKAHLPAQGGIVMPKLTADLVPFRDDFILNKTQIEKLKEFKGKTDEITYENLDDIGIFSEPSIKEEITEIDVVEPIPIDRYVDFEEPKKLSKIAKIIHRQVKKNKQ